MHAAEKKLPTAHTRFLGFDLLRGICALMVAIYHVCLWEHIADLKVVGNYNVYIFFVLSGVSMTIAYADKFADGMDLGIFLGRRFFRLAPLYWLLVLCHGHFSRHWAQVFLNLTFLFGFANATITSRVTAGWSLGIEFIFYFLFPVFLLGLRGKWQPYAVLGLSILVQLLFIDFTIRTDENSLADAICYTQFASFTAYFFGGCLLGKMMPKLFSIRIFTWVLWARFLCTLAAMEYYSASSSVLALKGLTGFLFLAGCLLCVGISGLLPLSLWGRHIAELSGRLSYGLYLLHPLLYVQLSRQLKLHDALGAPLFCGFVLLSAAVLALLLEKYWEQPIKRFGYRLLSEKKANFKI